MEPRITGRLQEHPSPLSLKSLNSNSIETASHRMRIKRINMITIMTFTWWPLQAYSPWHHPARLHKQYSNSFFASLSIFFLKKLRLLIIIDTGRAVCFTCLSFSRSGFFSVREGGGLPYSTEWNVIVNLRCGRMINKDEEDVRGFLNPDKINSPGLK